MTLWVLLLLAGHCSSPMGVFATEALCNTAKEKLWNEDKLMTTCHVIRYFDGKEAL